MLEHKNILGSHKPRHYPLLPREGILPHGLVNFTMKCIQSPCPFLPMHSRFKHKQPLKAGTLLLPFREGTTRTGFKHSQKLPVRTRVITSSFIIGATSAVKAGDISVLLQTGGLLLLMYGITNFVVPSFISKNIRLEKVPVIEDDSLDDDDDDDDEETRMPSTSRETYNPQ